MDLKRAADLRRRSHEAFKTGDSPTAVALLQRATAAYALIDDLPAESLRAYADACRELGDAQIEACRAPAAMQSYQEAADLYSRLGVEEEAAKCARRIREGVKALRRRPEERLYLLVARYERDLARLAEQSDTEAAQGECLFHIASIFHRRERFQEAAKRYAAALARFERAPESGLQQAECHHRLGDLFAQELRDDIRAFRHFREAAKLYRATEPADDGRQINRILCELRLKELATSLSSLEG